MIIWPKLNELDIKEYENYEFPFKITNYSSYNNVKLYKDALDFTNEQLIEIQNKYNKIYLKNCEVTDHNSNLFNTFFKSFIDLLNDYTVEVYNSKTKKNYTATINTIKYQIERNFNIKSINRISFKELEYNGKVYSTHQYYNDLALFIKEIKPDIERDNKNLEKQKQFLKKGIEICIKNNIDVMLLNNTEIICKADEIERNKFEKENCSEGTEMEINCCDYCSYFYIGSHRCSCGNRRIELIVEGNFLDGYYAYAEAY